MDGRPNVRLLIDGEEHEPSTESICKFGHRCLTALRSHDDAHPFLLPVKSEEVPDYYDVIQVSNLDRIYARRFPHMGTDLLDHHSLLGPHLKRYRHAKLWIRPVIACTVTVLEGFRLCETVVVDLNHTFVKCR